jgi:uncharacterized protein
MESTKTMAEPTSGNIPSLFHLVKNRLTNFRLFSLIFLLLLTVNEIIIYHFSSLAGLILYFAILSGLILISAKTREEKLQGLWLALGLVPVIRIVSLIMPISEISQIFWYVLISIPTIIAVAAIMRYLKYSPDSTGLNLNDPTVQGFVAAVGIFPGAIGFWLMKPEALTGALNIQITLFPALVLILSTGFVEELAFRGVMLRAAGVLGRWDWIYIAAIYAVLQIGHGSPLFCVLAFLVSLFFGWIVKTTGSLVGASLAHGLFNVGLFLVFPHIF